MGFWDLGAFGTWGLLQLGGFWLGGLLDGAFLFWGLSVGGGFKVGGGLWEFT